MYYKKEFDLWGTVDSTIGDKKRYRFGDYKFAFWPSEAAAYKDIPGYGTILIGKGCKRRIWYRFNNVEVTNPMEANGWYKAMMGKTVETFVFDAIEKSGRLVANNVKFYNQQYNISGEVDAIVRDDNDDNVIMELKTFDGWFATKKIIGHRDKAGKWIFGEPKEEHLLQAFLYDVLNKDPKIKYTKLCYLARDSVMRTEFDITHTKIHGSIYPVVNGQPRKDINGSKMLERYEMYTLMLTQDTPPERDYQLHYEDEDAKKRFECGLLSESAYKKHESGKKKAGDFWCNYCPYRDHCWKL